MTDPTPILAAGSVAACLLLALCNLLLAARDISAAAARVFAAGFASFAVAGGAPLLLAANDLPAAAGTLVFHVGGAAGVAALWFGFRLRSGRGLHWWPIAVVAWAWILATVVAGSLKLSPAIQTVAAMMAISLAILASAWSLYRKTPAKNAADYALMFWLLLCLTAPLSAALSALGAREAGFLHEHALLFLPTLLTGIGVLTLLAVTLDAIVDSANLARTDALTGLHNRRAFDAELSLAVARAERYQRDLCLLLVDIDDFKGLNDTHGHPAGDAAIRRVARALVDNARRIDVVARIGGEEFALILSDTPSSAALRLAERMRQAIARAGLQDVRVSASFGGSKLEGPVKTPQQLIQAADRALYTAKQAGRDCVRFTGSVGKDECDPVTPGAAANEAARPQPDLTETSPPL